MGQLLLDGVPIGVPDRSVTAGGVSYDNTQSGLSATDVQGAVDEVAASRKWKKVAYSTPQALTQGSFTQVTLSATPNLANYREVMLVLCDIYNNDNNATSVEATTIAPIGVTRNVITSYAYPANEGYYTRAQLQFGYNFTTISGAYIQDGGNHTSNKFWVEIYAR